MTPDGWTIDDRDMADPQYRKPIHGGRGYGNFWGTMRTACKDSLG